MARRSARLEIVAVLLAGMAALALACLGLAHVAYQRAMRAAAAQSVRHAQAAFEGLEQADVDKLGAVLDALAADERLQAAFVARDRERLLELARPVFEELRREHSVTHWYFIGPDRVCFLRVHAPELRGDRIDRVTLQRAADLRAEAAGKELGATAFAIRVVKPVIVGERLLGYYELAEQMDHFLERVKRHIGDDLGLVVDKDFLDAAAWARMRAHSGERDDWGDRPNAVVVDATTTDPRLFDFRRRVKEVPDDGLVLDAIDRGLPDRVRGVFPVRDAYERKVGAVYLLHDTSALRAGAGAARGRSLALAGVLGLAVAALLAFLLDARVFSRVRRLERVLERAPERLRAGEADLAPELAPGRDDELGRLERAVLRLLAALGGARREAEARRNGGPRR